MANPSRVAKLTDDCAWASHQRYARKPARAIALTVTSATGMTCVRPILAAMPQKARIKPMYKRNCIEKPQRQGKD